MSSMFSITSSMLPSHLAIEMSIGLRGVVEILVAEILGTAILGGFGARFNTGLINTGLNPVFGAVLYQGIQRILCDGRIPSCDNLRPDWTAVDRKHHHPRSTRDGLTPALA
jgi:hypothetical protein